MYTLADAFISHPKVKNSGSESSSLDFVIGYCKTRNHENLQSGDTYTANNQSRFSWKYVKTSVSKLENDTLDRDCLCSSVYTGE